MSKQSTISVSPLLWLAPLPFVLAMCLPLELPGRDAVPAAAERVATAAAIEGAASAPHAAP